MKVVITIFLLFKIVGSIALLLDWKIWSTLKFSPSHMLKPQLIISKKPEPQF